MTLPIKTFLVKALNASILGCFLLCLGRLSILNAAPPQLKISGNQVVVASTGCSIRLRGADLSGMEYSPTGDSSGSAPMTTVDGVSMEDYVSIAAELVTVWHANLIRIATNQDYWFGCTANGHTPNMNAYRDELQAFVNYCSNNNVYVDFDLHWSGTSTSSTTTAPCGGTGWQTSAGQQDMPDMNSVTFWSSVASVYGNNPAVMFDLYNEPHDVSWQVWRDGGATGATPAYTPGLQGLLNAVRTAGANNICLVGGLQWAYDLTGVASGSTSCTEGNCGLTDTGSGYGVMYTAHVYSNKGAASETTWDPFVTVATSINAVDVEEFGRLPPIPPASTPLFWVGLMGPIIKIMYITLRPGVLRPTIRLPFCRPSPDLRPLPTMALPFPLGFTN